MLVLLQASQHVVALSCVTKVSMKIADPARYTPPTRLPNNTICPWNVATTSMLASPIKNAGFDVGLSTVQGSSYVLGSMVPLLIKIERNCTSEATFNLTLEFDSTTSSMGSYGFDSVGCYCAFVDAGDILTLSNSSQVLGWTPGANNGTRFTSSVLVNGSMTPSIVLNAWAVLSTVMGEQASGDIYARIGGVVPVSSSSNATESMTFGDKFVQIKNVETISQPAPNDSMIAISMNSTTARCGDVLSSNVTINVDTMTDLDGPANISIATYGASLLPFDFLELACILISDSMLTCNITKSVSLNLMATVVGASDVCNCSMTVRCSCLSVSVWSPSNQSSVVVAKKAVVFQATQISMSSTVSQTSRVAAQGQRMTYAYVVTNNADYPINFRTAFETGAFTISSNVTGIINGTTYATLCPSLLSLAVIDISKSFICHVPHTLTQEELDHPVPNEAVALYTRTSTCNARATATVTFYPGSMTASLDLQVVASPQRYGFEGQVIVYNYLVTNIGGVPLENIIVVSSLQAACSGALGPLAPGQSANCTGVYTATLDQLSSCQDITNYVTVAAVFPFGAADYSSITVESKVTADVRPDLTLTSITPQYIAIAAPGDVTYTYTVQNIGNVRLNVSATSSIPGGADCTILNLAPGLTGTCSVTYTVVQDVFNAGRPVSGDVTIVGTYGCGSQTRTHPENPAWHMHIDMALLDLKLQQVTPAIIQNVGAPVTLTYALSNLGSVPLVSLGVGDFFGGCSPSTSVLYPGVAVSCSITTNASQSQADGCALVDTAVATANALTTLVSTESKQVNTIVPVQLVGVTGQLALAVTADPLEVYMAGQGITFNYTITNTGTATLTNLTINGSLPSTNCPVASLLQAGQTAWCTVYYVVTNAEMNLGNNIVNQATASGATVCSAASVPPARSSATVNVAQTDLFLNITSSSPTYTGPGQTITYTYFVQNTGETLVESIVVTSSITPSCSIASVAPGTTGNCTSAIVTSAANVAACTSFWNRATANGVYGASRLSVASNWNSAPDVWFDARPSISLAISMTPSSVSAPGPITITYTVANTGNVAFGPPVVITSNLAACNTTAPPASCTVQYIVTQADINNNALLTNDAEASAYSLCNNVPSTEDTVAVSSSSVVVSQNPSLSVTVTPDVTSYNTIGQTIRYTYSISNAGNVDLTALSLSSSLGVTCSLPTTLLAAQSSSPPVAANCTASYTTTTSDYMQCNSIANTVVVTATAGSTGPITDADSAASVNAAFVGSPALAINCVGPSSAISSSGAQNYTCTIQNTGTAAAYNLALSVSRMNAAPVCTTTTLAAGASATCSWAVTFTQAEVVTASPVTITATANVQVPCTTPLTASATVTSTFNPIAHMTITVTQDKSVVTALGDVITYNYNVVNTGTFDMTGLTLGTGCTMPTNAACSLVNLVSGASTSCVGSHVVVQSDFDNNADISNPACLQASYIQNGVTQVYSVSPSNGPVVCVPTRTTSANLVVTSVTSGGHTQYSLTNVADQTINITYTLTNTGNVKLVAPFTITSSYSTGLVCDSATQVLPGATYKCTNQYIAGQADMTAGSFTVTASARAIAAYQSTVVNTNSATSTITAFPAAVSVVGTYTVSTGQTNFAAAGDVITLSLTTTNAGTVSLTGLTLTINGNVEAGFQPTSPLAAGQQYTYTYPYTVVANDLTVGSKSFTYIVSGSYNGISFSSSGTTVVSGGTPSLSLTLEPDANNWSGATYVAVFTLTNTGTTVISAPITIAGTSITGTNIAVTCMTAGTLAAGATFTCNKSHTVSQDDINCNNAVNNNYQAKFRYPAATGPYYYTNNVTLSAPAQTQNIAITLEITANTTTLPPVGGMIQISPVVHNIGNVALTGPYAQISSFSSNCGNRTSPSYIGGGATRTICVINYRVTAADVSAGYILLNGTGVVYNTAAYSTCGIPNNGVAVTGSTINPPYLRP